MAPQTGAPRREGLAEMGRALDTIPDGFFLLDEAGTILAANAHARALCGPDARSVDGATLWSVLSDRAASTMRSELRALIRQRGTRSFDVQLHEADRWYAAHAYASHGRIVLHLHDVTARHNTEDALAFLAQASADLGSVLEEKDLAAALGRVLTPRVADWCLVALRDGANAPFRLEAAATRLDIRDRLLAAVEQGTAGDRATRALLVRGLAATTPALLTRKGNSPRLSTSRLWTLGEPLLLVAIAGREGASGTVVLGREDPSQAFSPEDVRLAGEIVAHAGLVLENVRLFEAERRATRLREDALTIVAHDLRSPVNAIVLGATALPSDGSGSHAEIYRLARRSLLVAARQMKGLLQNLLDAGRFTGWSPRDRRLVPLASLVDEVAQTYRLAAEQRGIQLEVRTHDVEDGEVDVDAARMQEALGNLVDNALKFTTRGGTVTIAVERRARTSRVIVRDTGCGIEQSALPHVFDRFWQARTSGRGGTGAGLGLFIARRIVEAHGGRIWVESQNGRGSAFHVELPSRDADGDENRRHGGSADA